MYVLKSLLIPVIELAFSSAIYLQIAPFFAQSCIFFSSQREIKRHQNKSTNQIPRFV